MSFSEHEINCLVKSLVKILTRVT